jgi:xanthine dehydrogenase accessory factor
MCDTFFEQAARLRADAEPFAFATVVACKPPTAAYPGARAIIADGKSRLLRISPDLQQDAVQQEGVYDFVMTCASQGALEIFVEPFLPRPELLVIGETPVAQALAHFGALLDFTVRSGPSPPLRSPSASWVRFCNVRAPVWAKLFLQP